MINNYKNSILFSFIVFEFVQQIMKQLIDFIHTCKTFKLDQI